MKKGLFFAAGLVLASAAVYGLLKLEPVAQRVTPKRYWKKKIFEYQRELDQTRKVELIKKIQLKKKLLTGDLDVAQDVILGIDRELSISSIQSEIEKLKESVADSQRAERELQALLTQAKEKFNAD